MNWQVKRHLGCLGLAMTALFFVPPAEAHQAQLFSPPAQASGYSLAFDDEFNTADISPNGSGLYTWYPGVWFFHTPAPPANFIESTGQLQLVWTSNQAFPETSIETLSANKLQATTFRYGYFEARMKWDPVTGAWPAFWMISIQDATGQNYYNGVKEAGELDIFEGQGAQPSTFTGTIHDLVNNTQGISNRNNTYHLPANNDFSQFHIYGMLWQPGTVTWYYDNQPLMSAPTPAIFDKQDYFMILGMQEGANWQFGNLTGVTASQMALTVDWVRVWQK
jgi:beta-glucanase (GH16 family)